MLPKLGIIAGGGLAPAQVIAACQRQQRPFFVFALTGQADPAPLQDVPHAWVRLGAAQPALDLARREGIAEVLLVGSVRRPSIRELRPDWLALRLLGGALLQAGDDGLLRAVARGIERQGLHVIGVQDVLGHDLAPAGPWGRHRPDALAEQDIARGVAVARQLGAADVGQAVVVQQGLVLALEAVEGTAGMLARVAPLHRAGPGGVLVKWPKPQQDRRLDLPSIGPDTVTQAQQAGLRGIALCAGAALVIDRPAIIAAADAAGLFVVGMGP